MKHLDKALTTGQLLTWFRENFDSSYDYWKTEFEEKQEDFIYWKYTCLERNEKLMQAYICLEMFIACDEEEKIFPKEIAPQGYGNSEKERELYLKDVRGLKKARKKVLFEGFFISSGTNFLTSSYGGVIGLKVKDEFSFLQKGDIPKWNLIEDLIKDINLTGTDNYWNQILKP